MRRKGMGTSAGRGGGVGDGIGVGHYRRRRVPDLLA